MDLVEYFHKTYYPDMDINQVASALQDPQRFDAAVNHVQKKHYPDIHPDKLKMTLGRFNQKYNTSYTPQQFGFPQDLIRHDGTLKGHGFLGDMPNLKYKGNMSSELSISSGDVEEGKDVEIPTMVPTLTQNELNHLLTGKYNPKSRVGVDDVISRKAIDFARERKKQGKPYYALPEEEGTYKITQ